MGRAVEALLLAGIGREDHRSREPAWKTAREYAPKLHYRGWSGAVIICSWRILRRLEARERAEIRARAYARVVMSAHHQHTTRVAARQPGENVDDVHHRMVQMPAHFE